MSIQNEVSSLIALIQKHRSVLDRIEAFYLNYIEKMGEPTDELGDAIVIADSLSKYYTCLETVFLRISKFFENDLSPSRWHQDLLDRMALDIPEIRPAVIGGRTCKCLRELLRFRHFTRYYFELDYDWDRISFIQKKFADAVDLVQTDLSSFIDYLHKLILE